MIYRDHFKLFSKTDPTLTKLTTDIFVTIRETIYQYHSLACIFYYQNKTEKLCKYCKYLSYVF